jgi:hypothetical protein
MTLSWRDVFDCKIPGLHILDCAKMSSRVNYRYFLFNDRVYRIENDAFVETPYTIHDVK